MDCLLQRRGVFRHSYRLQTFETRLHHTALVVLTVLVAVLVTQMNFHPSDMFSATLQGLLDHVGHLRSKRLGAVDVGVGVELDFHGFLLWTLGTHAVSVTKTRRHAGTRWYALGRIDALAQSVALAG